MDWQPSVTAARERLEAIVPAMGSGYARKRNFDFGPADRTNVSALSPWIRHGLISETEVLAEALKHHSAAAAEKFIQEVFWRGYFKGWLEHRPGVWDDYVGQREAGRGALEAQPGLRKGYTAAIAGATGIEAFDAWARELVETGYLHNHARMWFASIWVFTLRLPWALGADFFLRHLLDGDAASNTCSWRWVAGLHTAGKHYLARAENIAKFTAGRFDPSGQLDEDADALEEMDGNPLAVAPDLPILAPPAGPYALLLTPDSVTEALAPGIDVRQVIGLSAPALRSAAPVGDLAASFEHEAMAVRLASFACPAEHVREDQAEAAIERTVRAAKASGQTRLLMPWTTIGPYRDLLPALIASLSREGITLDLITRAYDRAVWPQASKGFFKLKQKIPNLLRELGLG